MSQVHPLARTTPRVRAEIRNSTVGVTALADLYNISGATVGSGGDLSIRALAGTIADLVGYKGTFVQDTSKLDGAM